VVGVDSLFGASGVVMQALVFCPECGGGATGQLQTKALKKVKRRRTSHVPFEVRYGEWHTLSIPPGLAGSVGRDGKSGDRRYMSARSNDSETLLTPAEVAALFRVDPKTVTRWAKAGKISSIRSLGGHRRFRESEIRGLLGGEGPTDE
jgi:excisionase family DNA binding protein